MQPQIIEQRAAMLESYLRVAALEADLLPLVLEFLSTSTTEALSIIRLNTAEVADKQASLNEGELLIATLENRLIIDEDHKMSALDNFNAKFFSTPRTVKRNFATMLMSDLMPLCGDATCGSLAVEIVDKAISCSWSRNYAKFQSALFQTSIGILASMHLDGHLLGQYQGDSRAQAFSILSLLHEHYVQSNQSSSILTVLNNNERALEAFNNWTDGKLVSSTSTTCCQAWVGNNCSDCPEIEIENKCAEGGLEVRVKIISIKASPRRVAECILDPDLRKQWNEEMTSGRVVKELTPTTSVLEYNYMVDGLPSPHLFYVEREKFPSGDIEITYSTITDMDEPGQFISSYLIESSAIPVALRKGSGDSTESYSPDSPPLSKLEGTDPNSKLTFKARFTGAMKKIKVEDFANGGLVFNKMWKSLRNVAEAEFSESVEMSPHMLTLHIACLNKILHRGMCSPKARKIEAYYS